MKKIKFLTILSTALILLTVQVGAVFAAPSSQDAFITGTITALACGTDIDNPTVLVTLDVEGVSQTVEIDLAIAVVQDIIAPDTECTSEALVDAIGTEVSIDPTTIIPVEEELQHPVGAALSLFFADIADYDTIMTAHDDGTGFGVLAQALWLTMKMEGNSDDFLAVVDAKKSKDFSYFSEFFEEGATPQNWGQFKKAALNGDKKANLGVVMSDKDKTNNGNGQDKDKSNNGNKDKNKDK